MAVALGSCGILLVLRLAPSPKRNIFFSGQEGFCCMAQGPHVGTYVGFPEQASGDRSLKPKLVF